MPGKIIQVSSSQGGVPKTPLLEAEVDFLGICGDSHRFRYHGGPRKALLLIASEVIDTLRGEGWPVFYGALGENLTTLGIDHREWRPGVCYRAGNVVLRLTTPRQPCSTLSPYGPGIQKRIYDERVKALDYASPHWGESGFYAAVVRPGVIRPDDIIELTP